MQWQLGPGYSGAGAVAFICISRRDLILPIRGGIPVSDQKTRAPQGSLKISEDVIATIASVAALEIEGVAALAQPSRAVGRLFFKPLKKPIRVTLCDDFVDVDLSINLEFGAQIAQVCTDVQNAVKDNVQTMSGMAVGKVNVLVSGIVFQNEDSDKEE